MNSINLEKRMSNSRFSINKNFIYFLIAPIIILLVGAIILSTCGYNLGYDFTGGTTFRMFINKDNEIITTVDNYDLENRDDFNEVYNKVVGIVEENGGKVVSFKTTGMTVLDYNIMEGQAIEVTFQNSSTDKEEIETQNNNIKQAIVDGFELSDYEKIISEFDVVAQKASSSWVIALVCSAILAFVAGVVYIMARYCVSALPVGIILLAFDLFMMLSLILICRVPIGMSIGGVVLATTLMSLFNLFRFYNRVKEGHKAGKFDKLRNSEISDSIANSQSFIKTLIYIVLALITLILVIVSVDAIRFTALSVLMALIVTYYNSQFILPSIFTVLYRKNKKKKV